MATGKSRPADTMKPLRRSTAEERAVNRGTPRPIPIAHHDFSSRLAPQPIYAAPAPGGPAARPWSRRAHPTATWSPGVARPPCWPAASAAGRHTDGAQRPHSAPRPIPTMTAGILTNASPSTIKTLRYRSTFTRAQVLRSSAAQRRWRRRLGHDRARRRWLMFSYPIASWPTITIRTASLDHPAHGHPCQMILCKC